MTHFIRFKMLSENGNSIFEDFFLVGEGKFAARHTLHAKVVLSVEKWDPLIAVSKSHI